VDASGQAAGLSAASQMRLSEAEAEQARVLAARVALRLSPSTRIGLAYAQGADGMVAQLQGQDRPAFMIAGSASDDTGLFRRPDMALALRQSVGRFGLTFSTENGQAISGAPVWIEQFGPASRRHDALRGMGVALDRDWGALDAALSLDWLQEDRTVLGARFHDSFGAGGSDSLFLGLAGGWSFAPDWRLGGAARRGWTWADRQGLVTAGSRLESSAWSIDLERRGVLASGDAIALRLSQPLRVDNGGIMLNLPSFYSYDTQSAEYTLQHLNLTPNGRELDAELAWRGPLWGGQGAMSLFWRADPGHYAATPDDGGVALRWNRKF
jgi:hypothetical protein